MEFTSYTKRFGFSVSNMECRRVLNFLHSQHFQLQGKLLAAYQQTKTAQCCSGCNPCEIRCIKNKLQVQVFERPSSFAKRVVWDNFTIAEMTHDLYAQNIIPSLNLNFQLSGQAPIYCETALQLLEAALIHSDFEMAASSLREILANSAGGTSAHLTREAKATMRQIVGTGFEKDPSSCAFYDTGCMANIVVNQFMEDNPKASTAPAFAIYHVPSSLPTPTGTKALAEPMIDCVDILHLLISQACKQYLDWLGQDTQPGVYKATILLIKPPEEDHLEVSSRARYD
jgi:hypothetical protein